MKARAPKGTADLRPDAARVWEHLVRRAQELFSAYGYEPIYTPVFEHTEVFSRGIGEATDIVSKEMYTFEDRAGRSLTLRPEGTAPIVRAALEHTLVPQGAFAKYYYSGPMFRYERPQAGRMRQFWQIGIEILGADQPSADAEVVSLLVRYFEDLGVREMRLLLNSMGDEACRPAYRTALEAYIREHAGDLCEECVRRADTNPLRAFDCKKEACVAVMAEAPLISGALCDECAAHYRAVKDHLDSLGIVYEEDPSLVRGLDYYTRTVFEVQSDALGAQNALGGGGRYDRLMEAYGGAPTPGLGFALGFERTKLALEAAGVEVPTPPIAEVFVATVDGSVAGEAFRLASRLRDSGFAVDTDHQGRSLRAQFKQADRVGARLVVVVGPDEVASGRVTVRDMAAGEEQAVPIEGLEAVLTSLLSGEEV